jgi:DNA mismatch repair ATPase MutS
MYYPKFINDADMVTNDCKLDKNLVITGPNASGKTTILKSALINILLSQQIGFGCFESLKLQPFDKFHCYLNIPDTSARDSLFQAEARRCKDIIDSITNNADSQHTHFCIFDELYSGTNPEEAVISANAFMKYIVKSDNVTCLLTTHYVKLCKKLEKNKRIENYNMKTNKTSNTFEYTYKLVKGISTVKGGLKVLSDMNYPNEIITLCENDNNK